MDQNTQPNPQQKKAKQNRAGIIAASIIAGLVIICGVIFLILEMTKPSASQAMATAKNAKVDSLRAHIMVKSDDLKDNTAIEFTNHVVHSNVILKADDESKKLSTWITKDKAYMSSNNGKWYYSDSDDDDFSEAHDEVKESTDLKQFLDLPASATNLFKVSLDGIKGYTLTYSGNNKKIRDTVISDAKNVNITIHLDRNKHLRDLNATARLKDGGSASISIYDVNNVKNLTIPNKVKKDAQEYEE